MDFLDAMAINGRWVRLRLTSEMGGQSLVGFVGGVVIAGNDSPMQSHICFEERLSRFSPCGGGSELFFDHIEAVEKVYQSAPRVVALRVIRGSL